MLSNKARKELEAARKSLDEEPRKPAGHSFKDTDAPSPREAVERRVRQQAWQRIQEESPETADFMQAIRKRFGPLAGARVEIDGECVVDTLPEEHKP